MAVPYHIIARLSKLSGIIKFMTHLASNDDFVFLGYDINEVKNSIHCHWRIGEYNFTEVFVFPEGGDWKQPAVKCAVKWLFLLAGVSYYKTLAPARLDMSGMKLRDDEVKFLEQYYRQGLGEFAYRADLAHPGQGIFQRVSGLEISHYELDKQNLSHQSVSPMQQCDPLVPFGGGIDSLVSIELLRAAGITPTLFIVNKEDIAFPAVDNPAASTGLSVIRAERYLDKQLGTTPGFLNGHVPVTGIISAMAVVAAALAGKDAVVMSNEWSASSPTLVTADGIRVNHQYSKSEEFEYGFNGVLVAPGLPNYFSLLRPWSELWIAQQFTNRCAAYFDTFYSCNKAFILDEARRSQGWCGACDKCAFIDLILSPFLSKAALERVFSGIEPLQNPDLVSSFRGLLGMDENIKPWECVGDVGESRVAMRLMSRREDRRHGGIDPGVKGLLDNLPKGPEPDFLTPNGHRVPERYLRAACLE